MTKELMLLQDASNEIKKLRNSNSIMSAKLDMFDKCFMLLTAHIDAGCSMGMGEDVAWQIDNHIADQQTPAPNKNQQNN